jgi:hypothetical protein
VSAFLKKIIGTSKEVALDLAKNQQKRHFWVASGCRVAANYATRFIGPFIFCVVRASLKVAPLCLTKNFKDKLRIA